jgi:hypothetical protein
MGFFKSSTGKKPYESGLSLLQGLGILAVIGIIAAVLINYFR